MKIFNVGGSVRDELLGVKSRDLDYLVTGATPDELIRQGYRQVGKDFPVFLSPVSNDEYALARTELKSGVGYGGFTCAFGPEVTVKQDLERRDLTINAIAKDGDGNIHDPFGGLSDINNKVLRHVSLAFEDDPVRVLRVARFMARYKHLGFKVADETQDLMCHMVNAGRLNELTSERVWKEVSRAIMEPNPDEFFITLKKCGALERVFPEINSLFDVKDCTNMHQGSDIGTHTMMAINRARALSGNLAVMTATLLHDLGSVNQSSNQIINTSHGVKLVSEFCKRLKVPADIRVLSEKVAEFHLQLHNAMSASPGSLLKLVECLDGIRKPQLVIDFSLACQADSQGYLNHKQYPPAELLKVSLKAAKSVSAQPFLDKGYHGKPLGEIMRQERIRAIGSAIKSHEIELLTRVMDSDDGPCL